MNFRLEQEIEKVRSMTIEELCEKFNCKPKEICMGDYFAKDTRDTICPYKVILGYANFEFSDVVSLGKLEVVYGKKLEDTVGPLSDVYGQSIYSGVNLRNSKITDLGKLKKVYGSISLNKSIKSMGHLEFLGSNLFISNTNVEDLGNITEIDGTLNLEDDQTKCLLKSLGKLQKVRRLYINSRCLQDLGDLEEVIELKMGPKCNDKVISLIERNLIRRGSKHIRKELNISL